MDDEEAVPLAIAFTVFSVCLFLLIISEYVCLFWLLVVFAWRLFTLNNEKPSDGLKGLSEKEIIERNEIKYSAEKAAQKEKSERKRKEAEYAIADKILIEERNKISNSAYRMAAQKEKSERKRKEAENAIKNKILMEEKNSNQEETSFFETNNERMDREFEEGQKNAKIKAFKRKNFQSEHTLPTNSQKEKAWTGECYACKKSEFQTELSFWWKIYPKLEVVTLCDKCAEKEGLIEEQETIAEKRSRTIPEDVKDAVWRRDEAKCTQCGSNENLEFDHIIPHSKGGANTKRNLQLLCEPCNRKKSDKIG